MLKPIITDHKPMLTILGPKKEIPPLAATQLQRWAVLLSTFNCDIKFQSTHDHGNVDGLSHLPLPNVTQEGEAHEVSLFNIAQINFW